MFYHVEELTQMTRVTNIIWLTETTKMTLMNGVTVMCSMTRVLGTRLSWLIRMTEMTLMTWVT